MKDNLDRLATLDAESVGNMFPPPANMTEALAL
jgi:hypothetical protein